MAEIDSYLVNRAEVGVLSIPLNSRLSADTLSQVLAYLSDTYRTDLWLSRAGESLGFEPFSDYYDPTDEEELYVLRLEIGTPNFVEIVGQVQHLVPVLASLAGALGVATAVLKIIQGVQQIKINRLDIDIRNLDKRLKEEELKTVLTESEERPARNEVERVYVLDVDTDFYSKAEELAEQGKITEDALVNQGRMQEILAYRAERILPGSIGKPTLILLED